MELFDMDDSDKAFEAELDDVLRPYTDKITQWQRDSIIQALCLHPDVMAMCYEARNN